MAESEHMNKQTSFFVRVRGKVGRAVLLLFLTAPPETVLSTAQISRKLKLDYNAVWSALGRLCAGSLLTHVARGFTLAKDRRLVAQAAYDAEGKPVSRDEEICSLSEGALGRVPRASEKEAPKEIHLNFHPWTDIVAWKEGWPENRTLPTIRFPPFIIHQLRLMATRVQGTSAGWIWVDGQHFKIRIASREALQIYLGEHKWKNEFKEWLTTVPNLTDADLDMVWNKIAQACNHQRVTYEFHVPDAHFTAVRPDCFREDQSQRWSRAHVTRIQLFSSTASISADRNQGRGGIRGASVHQPRRTVRSSRTLRETILGAPGRIAEGSQERAEGRARDSSEGNPRFTVHHRQAARRARTDTCTIEGIGRCSLKPVAAIQGGN